VTWHSALCRWPILQGDHIVSKGTLGPLSYVEVNDQYAFFCGSNQLRIFSRDGGALVYHLCMKNLQFATWDVLPGNGDDPCPSSLFQPQRLHEAYHVPSTSQSNFIAGKFYLSIYTIYSLYAQLMYPPRARTSRSSPHQGSLFGSWGSRDSSIARQRLLT
jgi:hypothetical protein